MPDSGLYVIQDFVFWEVGGMRRGQKNNKGRIGCFVYKLATQN